ncbi:MAG: transposase [Planctomycetaceae bacterium]
MPRRPRFDAPDTWHHVMNRGIARRTILENDLDRRFFLSLLAREGRAGRLIVHAFSLMLTHFHLLVYSPVGQLSEAMRRIQNRYARWFNRTRRRDGSLFRGRFLSKPIDSVHYRRNVLVYIHDNAVHAGLVAQPEEYAWSSAAHLSKAERPHWLATDWVDEEVGARGAGATGAARLAAAFPSRVDEEFRAWVERQLSERLPDRDEDVALRYAGSQQVVRWTLRKSELADGTRPWQPVAPSGVVDRLVQTERRRVGPLLGLFKRKTKDAWTVLRAGLLRLLAGTTHDEIALRVARHPGTISRDVRDHARLLGTVAHYEALVVRVTHAVLGTI